MTARSAALWRASSIWLSVSISPLLFLSQMRLTQSMTYPVEPCSQTEVLRLVRAGGGTTKHITDVKRQSHPALPFPFLLLETYRFSSSFPSVLFLSAFLVPQQPPQPVLQLLCNVSLIQKRNCREHLPAAGNYSPLVSVSISFSAMYWTMWSSTSLFCCWNAYIKLLSHRRLITLGMPVEYL